MKACGYSQYVDQKYGVKNSEADVEENVNNKFGSRYPCELGSEKGENYFVHLAQERAWELMMTLVVMVSD